MAETIGDLSVDLRLASAKFEQGVGRVNQRMDGMQRQAERASRVFQGLLAIGAGTAFSGMIKGSLDAANRLNDLSDRLGIAVNNLSRLEYAAKVTGVAQSNLTTGLQRMTRRISEAARGTGEAVDALQELGLSAEELNRLSPDEQFYRLADALNAVPNQADKVRLGMKLLDSEGVALLQTMKGGSDAIRQLGEESDKTGNTITAKFAAKATQANAAIIRMKGAAQGLTNEFALSLAPAIETAATWMADNAEAVRNGSIAFVALVGSLKAASAAQASFNAIARLNPYIAIATAVGIATAAIYEFATAQKDAEKRVVSLWEKAQGSSAAYQAAQARINDSQAVYDELVKRQAEKQKELNQLRAEGFKKYSMDGNRARELEQDIAEIVERRTRLTNARIEADKAEAQRRKQRQAEEEAYLQRMNELLEQGQNIGSGGSASGKSDAGNRAEKLRASLDERFAIQMEYRERLKEAMELFAEGEIDLAERTEIEKLAARAKARDESGLNAETRKQQYDSHIEEFKQYQKELTAQQQREASRRAQIEQQAQNAIRSLHQSTWQEAASFLNVFAGQSKAAAIASIAITKGLAIAQTMAHTQTASMLAYSSQLVPGDPSSIARASAAASAVQTMGAIKVGLIAATGLAQAYQASTGGGSVGTGGYSSSGTNPPVPSSPSIPSSNSEEDDRRGVQINFYGDVNGLDADQIARSIKDHLDSTDFVLVEPASRNGRALSGR